MYSKRHRAAVQRKSGFSLAEVVVALVIFGMAATVLGRAVSDALHIYAKTRERGHEQTPVWRVRHHVLQLQTRAQIEEGGELEVPVTRQRETSDGVDTEMVRVRWEAEVKPTTVTNVFVLELTAEFQTEDDNSGKEEQEIIAYRPGWVDGEEAERLLQLKEEAFEERRRARGLTDEEGAS